MRDNFYFYDLETSGLNPRGDRVMQFAGQRTDSTLQPIGEPDNFLVALSDDTLPSPGAIMVTGITPQATLESGISEPEFCRFITEKMALPGTTIMGYNSIRFDDEFVRATLWRNFYDPYEWQWKDGRSRWDMLDVVRLTRALRPEGINWPVRPDGRPTNRLELITKANQISHAHAHDALADVIALIEVTKLIRQSQPQLFEYLYKMRNKRSVQQLVNLEHPAPFVYASGRYSSEFGFTTVAYPLLPARNGNVVVYDLRVRPQDLLSKIHQSKGASLFALLTPTVKTLQYNHCPAVAPLSVLQKADGWKKLQLTPELVEQNLAELRSTPELLQLIEQFITAEPPVSKITDADEALYDGFLNDHDRLLCQVVRNNGREELADFHPEFNDERLPELLLHYKGRNFPEALAADEVERWEAYRIQRLKSAAPRFLQELQSLGEQFYAHPNESKEFLLEELSLWYQSLQPSDI